MIRKCPIALVFTLRAPQLVLLASLLGGEPQKQVPTGEGSDIAMRRQGSANLAIEKFNDRLFL